MRIVDKAGIMLEKYEKRFGGCFPLFMVRDISDEALIALIEKCFEDGKEYDPPIPPDILM